MLLPLPPSKFYNVIQSLSFMVTYMHLGVWCGGGGGGGSVSY